MKKCLVSIIIFVLVAVMCVPLPAKAEETPAPTETVQEPTPEATPEATPDPTPDPTPEVTPGAEPEGETDPSAPGDTPQGGETGDGSEQPEGNEPAQPEGQAPEGGQDPEGETEPTAEETTEQPEEGLTDPDAEQPTAPTSDPQDDKTEESKPETEDDKPAPAEDDSETEEDKERQRELDKARAENKNAEGIVPAANNIWIPTIAHPCMGYLLSAEKYGGLQGLTDFIFFTAQESGSYSAYNAGSGMVILGKYQFTDYGAQGNGTATALINYMTQNCSAGAAHLYAALYKSFVVEKKESVNEWNACALSDTDNFMAMQDQFAYELYYLRGQASVEAAGISLEDRPWIVKGLCFSMFIALGPYNEYGSGAYAIATAGIDNKDSNAVFIEKACANMVSLYADTYPWLYGRYGDGSDTALGISDKDLALEILTGSLYASEEPTTKTLYNVITLDHPFKPAGKNEIQEQIICVIGKTVREYTKETTITALKPGEDYIIFGRPNKKHTKLTLQIIGKGPCQGQTFEKKVKA